MLTEEDAIRKLHVFPLPAATMALLARRKKAICEEKHFPVPHTFVLHLRAKLAHPHIADGTGKLAIPLHPLYVEIFQDDHLGAEWGIALSCLMKQLFHLFLNLFLLGLGFRSGQK